MTQAETQTCALCSGHCADHSAHEQALNSHEKRLDSHSLKLDKLTENLIALRQIESQNAQLIASMEKKYRELDGRISNLELAPAESINRVKALIIAAIVNTLVAALIGGLIGKFL